MELIWLAGIVFLAYSIEAALGFGCNILALTLSVHIFPLNVVLPALVSLNLVVSIYIVSRHRKAIDRPLLLRRFLPFMCLGMPFGMALFFVASGTILRAAFGVFVSALAMVELVALWRRPRKEASKLGLAKGAPILLLGGLMHGLYASGGPMAVYFASREIPEKGAFRSTLSTLWLLLNLVLMVGYALDHKLTLQTARICGWMIPPLIFGILAGEWLHGRLDERRFSMLVYLLLLGGGVVLVLSGL